MKVIIDTCSLLSLVRYYLPFDNTKVLFNFIKNQIAKGEIIIIDKVLKECEYNSKGLVVNKLNFLNDKAFRKTNNFLVGTNEIFPTTQFYNDLENRFIISKKVCSEDEYESEKNRFLNSADARMILYALKLQKENQDINILTEESANSNDGKLFKKIPAICGLISIPTLTLPEFLNNCNDINIMIKENS